jgi:hypothetical protein
LGARGALNGLKGLSEGAVEVVSKNIFNELLKNTN